MNIIHIEPRVQLTDKGCLHPISRGSLIFKSHPVPFTLNSQKRYNRTAFHTFLSFFPTWAPRQEPDR